jgi:glyoxylase-like metal-dependent hydrolase (beta-lactamase superfamily II)
VAEVEVRSLRLAQVELPEFHPEAPGTDTVYGFLVRDGAECILVDTGIGTGNALIDRLYKPDRVDLGQALEAVGASIGEISAVVNSHLHFDHCGNNPQFSGVPIYVQQAELDAAQTQHYTVPEWVDFPGANYVALEGDHKLSARLELRATPGHSPGHQSLLVHARNGVDLIAAQAAYTAAEFEFFNDRTGRGAEPGRLEACIESNAVWSPAAYVDSVESLHRDRPLRVYFSHDPTVWQEPA